MKAIVWTFLAVAMLAAVASGPAAAFDARDFFETQGRSAH
jgi:hypothetical protein